jgi:hypothetical protein
VLAVGGKVLTKDDARRIAAHIAKTDPNERPPWEHFIDGTFLEDQQPGGPRTIGDTVSPT